MTLHPSVFLLVSLQHRPGIFRGGGRFRGVLMVANNVWNSSERTTASQLQGCATPGEPQSIKGSLLHRCTDKTRDLCEEHPLGVPYWLCRAHLGVAFLAMPSIKC